VEWQRRVTTITDILAPNRVALDLDVASPSEGIEQVVALLRGDPRVLDWEALREMLVKSGPCLAEEETEFGICLPHARTEAVTGLIMSAARFRNGVLFAGCARPIRYIYCIAVPITLASDYLRIVGLLARLQRTPRIEGQLRQASTPASFVAVLADAEAHPVLA